MAAAPPVADSVLDTIGNTPVVKLSKIVPKGAADVFVKIEGGNPTGSYKDRMALAKIEGAEQRGDLKPGMTVVEFTGGSTGSSLAFVCAIKGYRFNVVSSDAFSREKLATMAAFGADVTIVPSHGKGINAELMAEMRKLVEEMAARDGVYWTRQFENRDSLNGYARIGEELMQQLDQPIDAFCGGVGTAGMLMGVSRAFREAGTDTQIYLVEPATSPIISQGIPGSHGIEGVGVGFVPPLLDQSMYDTAMTVEESDARTMARRLAREEGIFCGTSSGMNVAAAIEIARQLGSGHTVATVTCDTGLKYLAGNLFSD
ncbi:MAG: cysteine synthase family protein [Thermomicrobiales bacterium]